MVEVGLFCTLKNSSYIDYDIRKNDIVYVAGDMMVRIEEKDPYAYRKLFVIAKCDDKGIVNVNAKGLSMDGKNLFPVSPKRQEQLYKAFEEANKPEES